MKTYGLMAEFDSPAAVLHAAEKVRDAGYSRWDVFTPFPIHGIDKVMGYKNSHVGLVSLALGVGAFVSVVGLIWYCNTYDYPLIVGGKPMFSPPMTFVPSYILMIMGAAFGALLGMLALNQLPRLHHPLLAKKRFDLVTRDRFVIVIGANDKNFQPDETRQLLAAIGGTNIETVEDPE
jgi:heme A synthase